MVKKDTKRRHDHQDCVHRALQHASAICARNNLRLTPLRRRVLELVWQSHKPVLAYDLLDELKKEKRNAAPPTVYRALDFLLENRLVHKIESRNAYIGCSELNQEHSAQFLICQQCNEVAEISYRSIKNQLNRVADKIGFEITDSVIEIKGVCQTCRGH